MTRLVFLDTETTGLDPYMHEIWELAYILRDDGQDDREVLWHFGPPQLSEADPTALRINRYYERTVGIAWDDSSDPETALRVARDLDGRHIVGAVPNFDAAFITRFLLAQGQCPTWHYHLIDVETLAVGWIAGYAQGDSDYSDGGGSAYGRPPSPPWSSDDISRVLGVEPPEDRHTALGDARWARAIYDTVTRP